MSSDTVQLEKHISIQEWAVEEAKRLIVSVIAGSPIRVYMFGSRANGTARRFSDIDIALDANGNPVEQQLLEKLRDMFEESHIPFRVDIVDLVAVPEDMREAILEEGYLWKS
ncbi:MAG: nucleotidyltransferase domain-containing protein [Armatimonadetes bacterium]|nr:nucleotidyltransferase domain-containing protein [Armatimonadota bacterium]